MKQMTQAEILEAFDPIDRSLVSKPDLDGVVWDDYDYFGWHHPDGHRAFMVVPLPERTVGLVFRPGPAAERRRSGLCSLCLSTHREAGSTLAMVDSWQTPRITYGIHICADFDCSLAVRGLRRAGLMGETISRGQRIERLQMHLARFVRKVAGLS